MLADYVRSLKSASSLLAMTHRRGWYVLLGQAVSVAVQLSDIPRHFHTGEELGVTRFSSGLSQGNAMTLVCCRKTGPLFSLSRHEWLAHFARIAENWSAEDLLLTHPASQFRDRPGSHRELGCHQIELRGKYCKHG